MEDSREKKGTRNNLLFEKNIFLTFIYKLSLSFATLVLQALLERKSHLTENQIFNNGGQDSFSSFQQNLKKIGLVDFEKLVLELNSDFSP